MKKLMTMMMAVVPFGMFAQSGQGVYAQSDDIFTQSYADAGNEITIAGTLLKNDPLNEFSAKEVSDDDEFEVNDLLLADPDFDIQENQISYTKDQKTVFFSANKKLKVKKGDEADVKIKKSTHLRLFKASVMENGEWVNLEMLPFNGKNHSTGHPALNADDTKLYFVSDGPESTGKTDIFQVDLLEDGTYGKPANLGSKINSQDREVFPLIDESSVLYFASDNATDGDELNVFASEIIDNEPTAPVKLDVAATGSKADYMAAFATIDAETKRMAEAAADLRDLEILLESERLAAIESIGKDYAGVLSGAAYDFNNSNVVYTVQIGAFLQNVKTNTYEDSSVLFNHRYDDGFNRFYSGVFESLEEALAHMEKIQSDGHADAFVVGLKGKERFLPE